MSDAAAAPAARDFPVVDAWIQPWTAESRRSQPARNWALVDRYGGDSRLKTGIPSRR